jgi:Rv0078B-related antitoxin
MAHVIEADHERAAHAHQAAIYRAMTPEQRLQVALGMNRTVRELMAVGFRDRHPAWTEAEVRRAVADRILYASTG